jgi:hypothetical protein
MKKIQRLLIVLLVWTMATACGSTAPLREPHRVISTATSPSAITQYPTDNPSSKASSTSTQTPIATATPSEEQAMPSAGQEELKNEWFLPYTATILLFETCDMMMHTHWTFQKAEIDLVEARLELTVESNIIALVNAQIVNEIPSEQTGPFLWELDADMRGLIVVWEQMNSSDDLGGLAMRDTLFEACTPFWNNIETITYAAMDAGVSEVSLREMDAEIQDIIDELRNSVLE